MTDPKPECSPEPSPAPQVEALELAAEFEGEAKAHRAMGDKTEATKCLRAAYALRKLAALTHRPEPVGWREKLAGEYELRADALNGPHAPADVKERVREYQEVARALRTSPPSDAVREALEPYLEAALRHADGLNAQLDKAEWQPRRSHVEQARNTIRNLVEKFRALASK